MFTEKEYQSFIKYVLKREMQKSVTTAEDLSVKLNMDIRTLRNKLSRSSYSAVFFLQLLNLLGCKTIDLTDLELYINNLNKKTI